MIKSLDELKNFINWCKKNKVVKVSIEDLSFQISELGMIENASIPQDLDETIQEDIINSKKNNPAPEEDPDLFWSST